MTGKAARLLVFFAMFLMVFLLAADVSARGRGGGGRRGGGSFSRGAGGLNRGGSSARRPSPNISRRGPATGGTFGRGEGRRIDTDRGNDRSDRRSTSEQRPRREQRPEKQPEKRPINQQQSRSETRNEELDPEQRKKLEERVDQRQEYLKDHHDARDEFYDDWRHYGVGTSITMVSFNSLSCTPTTAVVGGVTYYDCAGVWYNRVYRGGNVTYLVVDAPTGH